MLTGCFHFGNSHISVQFSLFKYVGQMFADGGHTHAKQLCHRFLRSPYCLILYHHLYPAFLIRQLV